MQIEAVDALVIGAGPAGLMAAEVMSHLGCSVVVCDAKPSPARKFLMAGKSGLNIMNAAPLNAQISTYAEAAEWIAPSLRAFGPAEIGAWAEGLGQELFTGSSGRVFPSKMKASPLLRAWLARLDGGGVSLRRGWRWTGGEFDFETPMGPSRIMARVCILALGGASWARLGSDGKWAQIMQARGVHTIPFGPSNMGFFANWSSHMGAHFGEPVKGIALTANGQRARAEFVITARGVEGGGIYAHSKAVLAGSQLLIDLFPDRSLADVKARLERQPPKLSITNRLRRALGLQGVRLALALECARPLPADAQALAEVLKALAVPLRGPFPMDEAISTSGGVARDAVDETLMLRDWPGVFVAGEMLDWSAPTGGYLLTACLATGHWAGTHAARFRA